MRKNRGFTLIELLVVVAIISLLSSIVFASLNSARDKAKISALKTQLTQMRTLLNLEGADIGNYSGLSSGGWVSRPIPAAIRTCDQAYPAASPPSPYTAQANAICKQLVGFNTNDNDPYALVVQADNSTYSIETWTGGWPGSPNITHCLGSSGRFTFGAPWDGGAVYSLPGCVGNP